MYIYIMYIYIYIYIFGVCIYIYIYIYTRVDPPHINVAGFSPRRAEAQVGAVPSLKFVWISIARMTA